MAIKKLQNNFTTPEQSKRLLGLGVLANTADCVLENLDTAQNNFQSKDYTRWIIEKRHVKEDIFSERNEGIFLPCWSVGRLIEIFSKCYTGAKCYYSPCNLYKTEFWIERFERLSKIGFIDFSKLEE